MEARNAMYKFYETDSPLAATTFNLTAKEIESLRWCAHEIHRVFKDTITNSERIRFVFDFEGETYRLYTISGENKEVV